jgi:hypothetical protein
MSLKLDELRKRLLQQPPPALAVAEPSRPVIAVVGEPAVVRLANASESPVIGPEETEAAEIRRSEPSPSVSEAGAAESAAAAVRKPPKAEERNPEGSVSLFERPPSDSSHSEPASLHPATPEPSSPESEVALPENQIAEAVARVFEETATVQLRFDALDGTLAELGRIGASAEEAIEPLRAFHAQLAELAESFGPIRAVQAQLGRMAQTFEPMKELHDQMSQLVDSIQYHLAEVVRTLEPAVEFRGRILSLARSFDGADAMRDSLDELCSAFRGGGQTQFRPE